MPRGRFVNRPYEALQIKDYLQASSIATATATCHIGMTQRNVAYFSFLLRCFLNSYSYCHGHTNHRVVTCADQTHHFFAVDALEEL